MTDDVGDPKAVRNKKNSSKLERERQVEELRQILQTPGGRYFVWRFLSKCGIFRTTSVDNPITMAIHSGQRDVGLWLYKEIFEAHPRIYTTIVDEANERENR